MITYQASIYSRESASIASCLQPVGAAQHSNKSIKSQIKAYMTRNTTAMHDVKGFGELVKARRCIDSQKASASDVRSNQQREQTKLITYNCQVQSYTYPVSLIFMKHACERNELDFRFRQVETKDSCVRIHLGHFSCPIASRQMLDC